MAGTISEGKNADTDLVIYNDYPSLELDLRKPGINTGTTIYFNEGDSGYLQTFILIEDRQYEPAGYNASVSSLIATNIATGKTTTYSVDSSVNSGTNIGAFSVPNEITETAGAYECYLTFKSDKGNYSSPRWIYQVVSASNGTTIDLPEATAEQLESKLNGKISELRDNVVSLSNKIDHSVAIDTSDFIHAEQFNVYKTDTDTKIQAIKTTDEKQSNDIVTNKNNIAQNTSDISSLKSDMSSVKSDISTAQDNIKALQDKQPTDVSPDLTQIKSDIKSVQDDTKQNSKDIATLSADDSALQEKVADIQNTQSNHTSDITQLQSDLKSVQNTANSNKTDIATTKQDIATINEKLATIGTGSSSSGDAKVPQQVIDDVAQNKQDIAKNKTDIATNKQTIATNTTDITNIKRSLSADESQISTNTTNIAQNEQDIANLKKSSKELSDKVSNLPAPDDAALLKLHTIVDTNTHNISDNAQNITTINQKLAKMPTATDLANVTSTATDAKNTATEAKQQANDNATNIATLTDKVSKIKQPDLSDYAKKSDLPADKSAQVSKNTTDIANLTNKVNGIHLPDLSPYLKSSDAATTYLTTATASETYAKLTDIPADKSTDIAKNKQDIANINDKIKTLVVPDLSSYLTKTEADSTYAKKSDIPDTSNFITTTDADKKYATTQQAHKESQDAMKYAAMMGAKVEGELASVSQTATQASTQATTNAGDIYELQNDVSNLKANTPIPRKVTYDPKAPWTDTSFQNDCSILCTNPTSQYSAEVSGGNLYFTSMPGLVDLSDSDSGDTSKSNFAVGFKTNATDSSGNFYDTQQTTTSDGTGKLYIHKVNNSSFDTYSRVNNIGIQTASYSYSSKSLSLAIELAFAGNGLPAMLNGKTFNVSIEVRDTVNTDSASNSFSTTFMMKEASETSYYFGNNTVQLQNPYIYLDFDLSNSLLNGNLYLYSMTIQ